MGLITAALSAVGGGLADQWLEVVEADDMGEGIVLAKGVPVRTDRRNRNTKGSSDVISNGSIIHVNQNQFMMLVDGGKIIDYTAEPGYFKVDNSSAPSLFSGSFGMSPERNPRAYRRDKRAIPTRIFRGAASGDQSDVDGRGADFVYSFKRNAPQ